MPGGAQDRRLFFRQLARESMAWLEEVSGPPRFALAELPSLPAPALAALAPRICEGVEILAADGSVLARMKGVPDAIPLFAADEPNLAVFNRFNGLIPMGRIANELSGKLEWPPERALAHVRWLFLRLVRLKVCVPSNAIPPELNRRQKC